MLVLGSRLAVVVLRGAGGWRSCIVQITTRQRCVRKGVACCKEKGLKRVSINTESHADVFIMKYIK